MWQEFVSLMEEILRLYKQLLALSQQKRLVIVKVQMKELEELLKKEQQLINSINEKEQQRMKMLPELIRVNNINGKADKMLDLVKYCEGSHAEQIVKIHTELTETLRVLAKESKLNNDLVRQALSVVNYRLNILSGARVETTYAGKGNERVVNTRSCLNFEA